MRKIKMINHQQAVRGEGSRLPRIETEHYILLNKF